MLEPVNQLIDSPQFYGVQVQSCMNYLLRVLVTAGLYVCRLHTLSQ